MSNVFYSFHFSLPLQWLHSHFIPVLKTELYTQLCTFRAAALSRCIWIGLQFKCTISIQCSFSGLVILMAMVIIALCHELRPQLRWAVWSLRAFMMKQHTTAIHRPLPHYNIWSHLDRPQRKITWKRYKILLLRERIILWNMTGSTDHDCQNGRQRQHFFKNVNYSVSVWAVLLSIEGVQKALDMV